MSQGAGSGGFNAAKYYGESHTIQQLWSACKRHEVTSDCGPCVHLVLNLLMWKFSAGPARQLYLPDGLLARDEVPSYLNGELAGE